MRQDKKIMVCQTAIIVLFLCAIIIFMKITNAGQLFIDLWEKSIVKGGVPTYNYISGVENEFNNMSLIVNDLYPMNEYLMAQEIYEEREYVPVDSGYVIEVVEDEKEIEEVEIEESVQPEKAVPSDIAEAVSRNVVTGKVYDKNKLADYAFAKKFYVVTGITSLTKDIFRPAEFIEKDLSIKKDNSKPQILIFHTHSQETFVDSKAKDASTSIVGVGEYLAKLLEEKYGYNVIHDKSVYDLVDGKLDRSKAYTYAQEGISKILKQNPSIEVVIDLHRDGVAENMHLVTEIEGKKMAKLMFFNGISYTNVNGNISYLNNPFRDDNLAMSLQMYLMGEAYYPGWLRNNYINAYRYCLHNRGRSMLVEAGAQTNTFEEVKNAMEPLADVLDKLLSGQKAY